MSHVDPFNALGGFSVGIPPELVIDEDGNVVNNVNAPNANVTANRVYSNAYYWANGSPFVPNASAGGSNTQVQFNNNGNFGASSNFTFNSSTNLLTVSKISTTSANLGNVANLVITGGINGYFLQTDGAGNLTWAAATGNGGNGTPGGANTQVQFNDAGVFNGNAGFTYSKSNNTLTIGNVVANYITATFNANANIVYANYLYGDASNVTNVTSALRSQTVTNAAQPNITSVGTLTNLAISGNITGANWINASYFAGNGHNLFGLPAANITGTVANANFAAYAGNVTVASQPNITTLGNLTSLVVIGNTTLGNNVTANFFTGNLYGLANLARNVTLGAQPNITSLGTLTTLAVSGNTNLGTTNTTNLFANNFTVESNFTTLGNVVAGNVYANTGNIRANIIIGTLATGLQPNITTVGVLTNLAVSGNIISGNANLGNLAIANFVTGTLTTNAQPNINFVGNLGWLNVQTGISGSNGNITFNGSILGNGSYSNISITGNLDAGNYVQAERLIGSLSTAAQPNITSLGNLTSLTVVGTSNLGNVGNVKILGGNANFVLSTDGSGNLSWVEQAAANATVPGGLNTYIQFNDNGTFGGDNTLTWNKINDTLFVGGNVNVSGVISTSILVSNVSTGSAPFTVNSTTPVANLGVATASTVRNGAQPNITSLGTLTSLAVSGNVTAGNLSVSNTFSAANITTPGTIGTTNLNVTGLANFTSNAYINTGAQLFVRGNINAANSANINLGNVQNLHIAGGINGYVLSTDGAGNLSWAAGGSGGNGTPGGSNTQVQYNDSGTFGGSSFFTFNESTNNVQIAGNLIANSFTMGAGIYQFSQANVYFATTSSDSPNQPILSIEADGTAAVEYTIISTDNSANIRNLVKVSTVIFGNVVNYVEYSTLPVNGYIGDFTVSYDAGSITDPPTIQLRLSPQTANSMVHKIMVTRYND